MVNWRIQVNSVFRYEQLYIKYESLLPRQYVTIGKQNINH